MTYNFDLDRWYDNQRMALDARRGSGELTDDAYQAELDELERRYDDMTSRLDKPFELTDRPRNPGPPRRG